MGLGTRARFPCCFFRYLTRLSRNQKFPNHLIENFPLIDYSPVIPLISGNPVINISLNFLIVLSKIFQITG
uniref:Uncharacterized protein n=1 Tax=Candidatus Kentrum sp. LPFa TaxID=2126335 RepID=A0A450XGN5_9GAMM|nr:MAG: hypothetical protein BECKLPF1236A_GA0070988_100673 [Candidatus Kentron sp. LPFa]VFK28409.1 MAG: hypothetical protein BECKLPF1236C_GA0070990_100643 [Candidatus Kentron sp. LPFa]